MKFTVKPSTAQPTQPGLVLNYFSGIKPESHPLWRRLRAADKKQVVRYFKSKDFSGKAGEVRVILRNGKGKVMLYGLGEKQKWNLRKLVLATRRLSQLAKTERLNGISLDLESLSVVKISTERLAQVVAENVTLADYQFDRYKKSDPSCLKQLEILITREGVAEALSGVKTGQVIGEETNRARTLGNTAGGEMTPTLLAQDAQIIASASKNVSVKVLGIKEMKKLGMGAILGVAHGSAEEPKFIIMEYWGADRKDAPYVFVGKGVTFDSGGLNLKPGKAMNDMHLDMLGGAAVICSLAAVARLKLKVNVVGLIPSVENMPGSAGYRPGDILRGLSGKTIEVQDTDAEGRLILSDALTYAERYKPKLVIDVATLTGACMVALGYHASGLFTADEKLQTALQQAGEISGDYVWPLPMWEEYEEEVQGTFADLQNIGKYSPYAGATVGAVFLWQFARQYPWAHLDIAGPMKTLEAQGLSRGASGVGVRFLVEVARAQV